MPEDECQDELGAAAEEEPGDDSQDHPAEEYLAMTMV